jgi:hypothetical protein
MKRFKPKTVLDVVEADNGPFVLYTHALESMQCGLEFALKHREDIENDVGDFVKVTQKVNLPNRCCESFLLLHRVILQQKGQLFCCMTVLLLSREWCL